MKARRKKRINYRVALESLLLGKNSIVSVSIKIVFVSHSCSRTSETSHCQLPYRTLVVVVEFTSPGTV